MEKNQHGLWSMVQNYREDIFIHKVKDTVCTRKEVINPKHSGHS